MSPSPIRVGVVLLALGLLGAPVAWSQDGADHAPDPAPDQYAIEHQRIEALRDQKTRAFDEQERACANKFAVTDCENKIKAQRRQVLADLKRQDVQNSDAQRRQKAAEQLQHNVDKAADIAQHQTEVQAQAENNKTEADRQKEQDEKALNHKKQAHAPEVKATKSTSQLDGKTIEKNRAAYAEKLKELERRRQERDKNVREHGSSGPPLPPMPQ